MAGGGQDLGEAGLCRPEVILVTQLSRVAVNIIETKPEVLQMNNLHLFCLLDVTSAIAFDESNI